MAATKLIAFRVPYQKFTAIAEYCIVHGIKTTTEFLLSAIDLKLQEGQTKQPSQAAATTPAKEDVATTSEPVTTPKPIPQPVVAVPMSEPVTVPKPTPQTMAAAIASELVTTQESAPKTVSNTPISKPEHVQDTRMNDISEEEEDVATQFARKLKIELMEKEFCKKIEPFLKSNAEAYGIRFFERGLFWKEIREAATKIATAEDSEKALEDEYEAFIKIAKDRLEAIKAKRANKAQTPKKPWHLFGGRK